MKTGILPLVWLLCIWYCSLGNAKILLVNMCATGKHTSPEMIILKDSRYTASTSGDVCSCNITSNSDFYVSLKRFNLNNITGDATDVIIRVTHDNDTVGLDLPKMNSDPEGSDCLLLSGNRCDPFRPRSCWLNTKSRNIQLETLKNMRNNSYFYLYILAAEKVTVYCTVQMGLSANESQILNYQSPEVCNKTSINDNTTDSGSNTTCNNITESTTQMGMNCEDTTDHSTSSINVTTIPTSNQTDGQSRVKLSAESERMMTASLTMLPTAGIVLLVGLLVLALAFRKQRNSTRPHSIKPKGSNRRVPKPEQPSYYEEVDEDLHINGQPITIQDEHNNKVKMDNREYDMAGSPDVDISGLPYNHVNVLNNYDVAVVMTGVNRGMASLPNTENKENDYNVASYNPPKKMSCPEVDSTYDKTNLVVMAAPSSDGLVYETGTELVDLLESNNLSPGGSQDNSSTSEEKNGDFQETSLSNSTPSVNNGPGDGDEYSLERFVSTGKSDDTMDTGVIHDDTTEKRELKSSDQRNSCSTDILEEELYANFSSLKSEETENAAVPEEAPSNIEEEEDIYINHTVHPSQTRNHGESLDNVETNSLSLVPDQSVVRRPGYINVKLNKSKEELNDNSFGDDKINTHQDPGPGETGSTVSLLNSSSDSEVYANYVPEVNSAKKAQHNKLKSDKNTMAVRDPKFSTSDGQRKSKCVEVVILPKPSETETANQPANQQKRKGHKLSQSVDESSKFQRKTDSHKQRRRSDDTLLLCTLASSSSGSEDDAPVMVNNILYDEVTTGLNINSRAGHQTGASVPSESDLNQVCLLPQGNCEDDDVIIMMKNDLYESFHHGGVSLLPDNVSREMEEKLLKQNHISPVNENMYTEIEKLQDPCTNPTWK